MPTPFYPPLSRLIDARDIPGDFQNIEDLAQDGIDLVLGKVFYKELLTDVSADGVARYYSLTILSQELKLPLLGSGMNLVIFHGSTTGFSEFPIIFDWRWEVYKYISQLTDGGFSALPEAFVDILLELADIEDQEEFIGQIVRVFLDSGDNSYQGFISNLIGDISTYDDGSAGVSTQITNITTQLNVILAQADALLSDSNLYSVGYLFENYKEDAAAQAAVNSIQTSIDTLSDDFQIDIDLLSGTIQSALGNLGDLDEKFGKLAQLFDDWFDGITKQDFYDLALPQFSLALQDINAALQFPRGWLLPVAEDPIGSGNWDEDPDPDKMAALVFTIGKLRVSTKNGLEFEDQSSFSFERAMIGKTGILLQFEGLKVDMSKAYNNPEADADGRPEDFMGMFAETATVTLPAKWFKDPDGTNAEIFGKKLLIGTGGVSGEIGLRALGGDNMFWAKLGNSSGFELGFRSFDILFKQNKVQSSNILAAMKIAKFVYPDGHAKAGQPVEIGVTGHIHDDGEFNLTAAAEPPVPIQLEDVFVYEIRSLELGSEDDDFYLGTSGKLEFQGFLKDTLKLGSIEIEKLRIYSDGNLEFEGGSISLVEPIVLPLGPVEITVTAMHYGSHQREIAGVMRKFNYFGFDGGVSVDPLGIEVRGDGVKYYYCTDDLPSKPTPYPTDPAVGALRAGQFQKTDGQYNTIRLLATSPFSYTEQGMPEWYIPEQNGLTPGILFCQGEAKVPHCADFLEKPLGQRYLCPDDNHLFHSNQAAFLLLDHDTGEFAEIVAEPNVFNFAQSLGFQNGHRLQIRLPQPSVIVTLLMSTQAQRLEVNYFASVQDDDAMQVGYGNPDPTAADPTAPHTVIVSRSDLDTPLVYDQPNWLPVTRIVVNPITADEIQITALQDQIATIQHDNNLIALGLKEAETQETSELKEQLDKLRFISCAPQDAQARFVNKYVKPDLSLYSATTFAERTDTYVYAVGATNRSTVVIKTTMKGETVWCLQLRIDVDYLHFQEIVQLNDGDEFIYVISAYDGTQYVLVCIDAHGHQRWDKVITARDAHANAFLLATPDKENFYFVYSDKDAQNIFRPKLLRFAANGDVLFARSLDVPNIRHKGFLVSAAGVHDAGLTIAGQLVKAKDPDRLLSRRRGDRSPRALPFAGKSIGVVVDLRRNLLKRAASYYEAMIFQDIAVFGPGKYVLSAKNIDTNNVVIFQRGLSRENYFYDVPETSNMHSVLCAGANDFYLATSNGEFGKVYRFDMSLNPIWTKRLRVKDTELTIRAMSYHQQATVLGFITSQMSLLGVSGPDFNTCITVKEQKTILAKHPLRFDRLNIKTRILKARIFKGTGLWRAIQPNRVKICAAKDTNAVRCNTLLHHVCWMSLQDYQYNIFVPGQPAIQEDTEATILGLTEYIQPIWRPDTSFVVRLALRDVVDDDPGSAGDFSFTFGFTTGGPVGYFHTHPNVDYGDSNHPDLSPLTSLRQYIDYTRSYPNADGNLLGAKPLFYDSEVTKIDLFFQKAWARHFFHEWPAYNGQPAAASRIKIVIKDPVEGTSIVNPPYLDYDPADTTHTNIPQTVESWQDDIDPVVPPIYQQYQHLLESQQCVLHGGLTIKPKSEYAEIVPKHLKPRKLYTAVVNNLYDVDKDGNFNAVNETREVHKFTFQTSRYKDFSEQINSYLLTHGEGPDLVSRPAIFDVRKNIPQTDVSAAFANVAGFPNALVGSLATKYQHRFDRLIEGIFALPPLEAAQTTEFNLIRNSSDIDKIVAVLIRNPEPFNNPRMPLDEVQNTVTVLDLAGNPAPGYHVLFSKDYSQVVIMHNSLKITGPWAVRFQYKLYNGSAYVVPSTPKYSTKLVGTVVVSGLDLTSS